jgi:hypothetical protein
MSKHSGVELFLRTLDERIAAIWKEPPSELKKILEPAGPYASRFPIVIYSYWNANALAGDLWILRRNAKSGVALSGLIPITKSIIDSNAVSFQVYGLTDTFDLLKKASSVLGEVKDTGEFIAIVEKLVVYLNRLGMAGWLDLLVPWQKLNSAFEEALQTGQLGFGVKGLATGPGKS